MVDAAAAKLEDLEEQLLAQEEHAMQQAEQASELQAFFRSTPTAAWELSAGPRGCFMHGGQELTDVNNAWADCLLWAGRQADPAWANDVLFSHLSLIRGARRNYTPEAVSYTHLRAHET